MSQAPDLSPIQAGEIIVATFDFGADLSAGSSVSSVSSIDCSVVIGTDAAPSSRIIASPAIAPSPGTGATNAAVRQTIGGMIGGCRYRLECLVETSDGQTLAVTTRINCNS